MWLLIGWALVALKLTIFRLTEQEKGALSVFSAVLTTAAGFVAWATSTV